MDKIEIIDINDIEDIILAKQIIDKFDSTLQKNTRSNLDDFISKYCILNDIIIINDSNIIAFNYIHTKNYSFLFVTDKANEEHIKTIINVVEKHIKQNKLKEISQRDFSIGSYNEILILNNKYYSLN